MSHSAPSAVSSSASTSASAISAEKPVRIIVDRDHASHIDQSGNCYVNPQDCAIACDAEASAYIFDIEFLQRLRRHIRKIGSFELDTSTLSRDLQSVASSLATLLNKNLSAGR